MSVIIRRLALAVVVTSLASPAFAQTSSSTSSSHASGGAAQPHSIGLGAVFGSGAQGAGVSVRYFFAGLIGVDARVAFRSSPKITSSYSSTGYIVRFMPSVIVMLKKANRASNVDFRPYAGGGVMWAHAGADTNSGAPAASGTGAQAFGGLEIQFRNADSFALSVQGEYERRGASLNPTGVPKGFALLFAVHFYR